MILKIFPYFLTLKQLGEQIGKGQYGSVFKAMNMKDGSFVAMKQMEIDPSKISGMMVLYIYFIA